MGTELFACVYPGPTFNHPLENYQVLLVPSQPNLIEIFACDELKWGEQTYGVKLGEVAMSGLQVSRGRDGDLIGTFRFKGQTYQMGGFRDGLCHGALDCELDLKQAGDPVVPTWRLSLKIDPREDWLDTYIEPWWEPRLILVD
jgi:hypothetical protein